MEFLRSAKRRSLLSELLYIVLNIGLAIAILIVVWVGNSPVPALLLVLLSKWRVLAVRPRYWLAHIQANMVDLIVSVGYVILLYIIGTHSGETNTTIGVQIGLTILYCLWLLLLKPSTKRALIVIQAGVALTIGTIALFSVSYGQPSSLVVLVMFLFGYSVARHVLSAHSDNDLTMISLMWGVVMAQFGWLFYHWTIAYSLPGVLSLKLPQATFVVVMVSFLAERIYTSYAKHGEVRRADVMLPALLTGSIVVIVVLFFNGVNSGNI